MKVAIIAKKPEYLKEIKPLLKKYRFRIVWFNPEIVFSVGGDGTYLFAERKYPGIPKLIIRKDSICRREFRYNFSDMEKILQKLKKKKFDMIKAIKLEAKIGSKRILGANDIVIRNLNQLHSIRFKVKANRDYGLLIGDGIVVATPFGSSAYYQSITKRSFSKGIGLGFNNVSKSIKGVNLKETQTIKFELVRGTAVVSADNNVKTIKIKPGDKAVISKAREVAKIIRLK